MKDVCVSISDFGSIADVNPWQSKDETLFRYHCKYFKKEVLNLLNENHYIIDDKWSTKVDKETETFLTEVKNLKANSSDEANELIRSNWLTLDRLAKKNNMTNTEWCKIHDRIKDTITKNTGTQVESAVIKKVEGKVGTLSNKNDKMRYKTVFEDNEGTRYIIGGKTDATSKDTIIEVKNRRSLNNVKKNDYDWYQLMGYMYLIDKPYGKIIQNYNNKVFDSDTETTREYGKISFDQSVWNEFLETKLIPFMKAIKEKNIVIPENLNKPILYSSKKFTRNFTNTEYDNRICDLLGIAV